LPTLTSTPTPFETIISKPSTIITVTSFTQELYPYQKNGKCSLNEAIWAAQTQIPQDTCPAGGNDGSTIVLQKGNYIFSATETISNVVLADLSLPLPDIANAAMPVIASQIHIEGHGAILQRLGTKRFRFFDIHPAGALTLHNLTLMGGDPGDKLDGGALQNMGFTRLIGVTLTENTAYDGGAISNLNEVVVIQSHIVSNTARHIGGAIYAEGGQFTFIESAINRNAASDVGGALYGIRSAFVFTKSNIYANKAVMGGAIFNEDSNLNIVAGSVLSANVATQDMGNTNYAYGGGGIVSFGVDSVVQIEDSVLFANTALKSSGGALTNWSGTVTISNSVLNANSAAMAGAILDGYVGGVTTITNSCIINNTQSRTTSAPLISNAKEPLNAQNNWWGVNDIERMTNYEITSAIAPITGITNTRSVSQTPTATPKPSVIILPKLDQAPEFCK
jgi:predicted outer membrane repeat protein